MSITKLLTWLVVGGACWLMLTVPGGWFLILVAYVIHLLIKGVRNGTYSMAKGMDAQPLSRRPAEPYVTMPRWNRY